MEYVEKIVPSTDYLNMHRNESNVIATLNRQLYLPIKPIAIDEPATLVLLSPERLPGPSCTAIEDRWNSARKLAAVLAPLCYLTDSNLY